MRPNEILYLVKCDHSGAVDLGLNVLQHGDDLWLFSADYYEEEDPRMEALRSQALVTPLKMTEAFSELKDTYQAEMQRATAVASNSMTDILTTFFFQNIDMFSDVKKAPEEVKIEAVATVIEETPTIEVKPIPEVVDAVTNSDLLRRIDALFASLQQPAPTTPPIVEPVTHYVNASPRLDKDSYVELLNPLLEKCASADELNDLLFKFFDTFVISIGQVPDTTSVYDYVVEKMLEV